MYAKKDCACIPYTHFCDWLHRTVEIHAAQLGYPPSPLQCSDAGRKLFQGVVHLSRKKYNSASRQSHWHPLEPGTCRWGSSVSSFHQLKRVFHILYIGKFTKLMYCLWYGRQCRVQTSVFAQLSAMLVGIDGGSSLSVHFFHQLFSVFLFWKSMVFPTSFSNFHFNFTVPETSWNRWWCTYRTVSQECIDVFTSHMHYFSLWHAWYAHMKNFTQNTVLDLCSLPINIVVCYAADSCLMGGGTRLLLLDHGAWGQATSTEPDISTCELLRLIGCSTFRTTNSWGT